MKTLRPIPAPRMSKPRRRTAWRTGGGTGVDLSRVALLSVPSQPAHLVKDIALPQPDPAPAIEDSSLMCAIANRDPDALSALYDRYSGILKALIIRVVHDEAEADNLLQEIFMQIWRQAKNYSQKKGQALGWIVTLTRRRAIDRLRKRQAYHRVTERLELETENQPDSWLHNRIDDNILQDDLGQFLRRRIEALPLLQRQAIDLAFFKGMSQREIAVQTGTPLGTIKTRLELGLRKLYDSVRGLRDKI